MIRGCLRGVDSLSHVCPGGPAQPWEQALYLLSYLAGPHPADLQMVHISNLICKGQQMYGLKTELKISFQIEKILYSRKKANR